MALPSASSRPHALMLTPMLGATFSPHPQALPSLPPRTHSYAYACATTQVHIMLQHAHTHVRIRVCAKVCACDIFTHAYAYARRDIFTSSPSTSFSSSTHALIRVCMRDHAGAHHAPTRTHARTHTRMRQGMRVRHFHACLRLCAARHSPWRQGMHVRHFHTHDIFSSYPSPSSSSFSSWAPGGPVPEYGKQQEHQGN